MGLYELDAKELNTDEATSFFIAGLDWGDTWTSLSTSEANGSPFYLMLHFWRGLGDTEFVLRLLPLMFGIATPVVLYFLVRRLFGPVHAAGAATLLAINLFFIAQTQDVRSYSLSAFLATLTTYFFVRLLEEESRWLPLAYVVSGALLIYAHFFGAWVLLVHAVSLLFIEKEKIPGRRLLISFGSIAVLVVPLALFILFQDVGQVDWIPPLSVRTVYLHLDKLTGVGGIVQVVLYGLLVVAAAVLAFRLVRKERRSRRTWTVVMVVLWLLVPLIGVFVISFVKPLFQARYLMVAMPAMTTCVVLAVAQLKRPAWVAIGFAAILILTAARLPTWYAAPDERMWDDQSAIVLRNERIDDAIVLYAPTVIRPFGYHYGFYRGDVAHPEILYPPKDWLGFSRTRFNPPLDEIAADARRFDRVWLVIGAARPEERAVERVALVDKLKQTCAEINREWKTVDLLLFEGCNQGP